MKIKMKNGYSSQYMIIERFRKDRIRDLYAKLDQEGRLLPKGVTYIDSWVDKKLELCFQLMESDSIEKIRDWTKKWSEYAEFEIFPVIGSAEAKKKVLNS